MNLTNTIKNPPQKQYIAIFLITYFIIMLLQLMIFTPGGRSDDSEALLMGQHLALGYDGHNPPLFYWLTWIGARIFGDGNPSIVFGLRMTFLFLMVLGTYQLSLMIKGNSWLALAAGLAPLSFLHLHWYAISDLTHTLMAGAIYPWVMICIIQISRKKDISSYIYLGILITAGLHSKYTFAVFTTSLLIAALINKTYRSLLFKPHILLTILIPLILSIPHFTWILDNTHIISEKLDERIGFGGDTASTHPILDGLKNLSQSTISVI
ncbi:glycosyltransferase family 39 protein, partial [Ectothiorhodospira lacustris]